jgi:Protein of unknown function (DUF3562)
MPKFYRLFMQVRPLAPIGAPHVEFRPTVNSKWQILIVKEPHGLILSSIHPMKHGTLPIAEQQLSNLSHVDTEIDLLARETRAPRELVARLYSSERAKLERTARIKTYVPVLIHRHVKALLREHNRA